MNCAAVPLFDAIGEDSAMADEPLDLLLSPADLLEFSPAAPPTEYGAGAHDGIGVATTAVCSWDCTSSRGDFELIRISNQLLFLIGSVEGSRTLSYELDATGWTCFAFVLSFSADGLASAADQRASRYLQISRGKAGPRTCPSSAKWTGVICLLKDRMDGPADEFSAAITPDVATEEFLFIPPDLAKTAMAVVVSRHNEHSRTLYRTAKCLELLDQTLERRRCGELLTMNQPSSLSLADAQRLNEARRIICESYSQPLTLDFIARSCGLNRAKLTRGFKEIFNCTIGEMLAEERLRFAATSLVSGDEPVSKVAFSCGYLSNASFARAFNRRFGSSPSRFREDARTAPAFHLPASCDA